ncbi:MAG: hypothetical protein IJI68_01025 [Eggerthellaceae bacterium]|nr:hypothetical protein [Eggerthellaceae bacterium]
MPRWTQAEEDYLRSHAGSGAAAIAEALGRTVASVKVHASRMGVSLVVRYHCPRCGRNTYRPLTKWTGWCRSCSIEESAGKAALKNRQIRREIAEEEVRIREAERRRQAIYSDTDREKKKLRKIRELRNSNETRKGKRK